MKVLIIEDEQIAADHLEKNLLEIDPEIQVLDQLDSIKSAVRWFNKYDPPELLFLDIQLADGLSFEIFEKAKVECPVIFTTAYDQYAIKAFKVNSIDYLLKPIVKYALEIAIDKFKKQTSKLKAHNLDHELLANLIKGHTKKYKERFVIKVGEHLKTVNTEEIELFYSQNRSTYLSTNQEKKYILDYTLDQIEELVDPNIFFRINRQYIVHTDCIKDIIAYSNSRLKVEMQHFNQYDMIVSRERVSEFKTWLDR